MQPLIALGLLTVAGRGSYRALRFGQGGRKLVGLVPIGFVLLGGVVAPFVFGILKGAGSPLQVAGLGGNELMIVSIGGSLFLAVITGAVLSLMFRPPNPSRPARPCSQGKVS